MNSKEANICEVARVFGKLENDGRLHSKMSSMDINNRRKLYIEIHKKWLMDIDTEQTYDDITNYSINKILLEYGNDTGGIKLQTIIVDIIDYIESNKPVDQVYWIMLDELKQATKNLPDYKALKPIYNKALSYSKEQ